MDDNWTESDGTGGVFNGGSMRIVFSTIALNGNADADSGSGGIENGGGTLTITSSTISANHSDYGAGAGIENDAGTVRMSATILAGNGQFDCNPENPPSAPITSEGYNIVGTLAGYPSCDLQAQPTDIVGTTTTSIDPKLKALGYYGGPTETMPPYPASPAVDAIPAGSTSADGTIALCPPAGTTDQRGVPRPQGPACDIGAVEVKE